MKLSNLSSNIVTILNEVMNNQEICKYLYYAQSNPLSQPNIADTKILMLKQLYPYPFNPTIQSAETPQLRVYYGKSLFNAHEVITDAGIIMDIIIPNSLFLVNDGVSVVRPYEIVKLLVNQFSDKFIDQFGTLFFKGFTPLQINDKYDGVRMVAETKVFG